MIASNVSEGETGLTIGEMQISTNFLETNTISCFSQ